MKASALVGYWYTPWMGCDAQGWKPHLFNHLECAPVVYSWSDIYAIEHGLLVFHLIPSKWWKSNRKMLYRPFLYYVE